MVQGKFTVVDFLTKKTLDVLQEATNMNASKKGLLVCVISYPEKGNTRSYPDLFRMNRTLDLMTSPRPKIGAVSVIYKNNGKEILRSRRAFLLSQKKVNKKYVLILSDHDSDSILLSNPKTIKCEKIDLTIEKRVINDFWVLMRHKLMKEPDVIKLTNHIVITLS